MTRERALAILHEMTTSKNLRRHAYAVEAVMRTLALRFDGDPDLWGLAGLLHDADYEMFKDDPKKHPSAIFSVLARENADERIINAIRAHAWGWRDDLPEPTSPLEWALHTSDELTGFIIACTLVRPDKSIANLTVDSILKKWPQKSFAAGVKREDVERCEEKLRIGLPEFIGIALGSMQEISEELGV